MRAGSIWRLALAVVVAAVYLIAAPYRYYVWGVLALALAAGVIAQSLARHLRLPRRSPRRQIRWSQSASRSAV